MRRRLLVVLFVLLLFSAVSLVYAGDWISGQVASVPGTLTYGGQVFFQFNFTVQDSDGSEAGTLSCFVPYALAVGSLGSINLGASQNMTGDVVSSGVLPVGSFLVSAFNAAGNGTSSLDLTGIFRYIWNLLGSFGNVIVSELQYFMQNSFNIAVPTSVMNTIVLVLVALVWWYARRLPWFVSIILFVVAIGLASNLVTTMHLAG